MKKPLGTSTDAAWEEWGRRDPYFGVITSAKYRRSSMDDSARREFFETGEAHVEHVLSAIRKHIDPTFLPTRVLDFGCGVGRLLIPFAKTAESVVGLDVSPSMLREARQNCDKRGLTNVQLILSDDGLSALTDTFDVVHSCIVFQHIPVPRGRLILANLLRHLRPGGVGALQLTYSKVQYAATHGVPPPEVRDVTPVAPSSPNADPEIQMNPYNLNEIFFLLQSYLVKRCYVEFTDHGGELGVFLYFSVAEQDPYASPAP